MASKENYNEPIYENLRFFKGLELVYRHPCIHLRTENKECGNCKYGLNNNCVIHNEYLKIKNDLEVLEILKQLAKGVIELKNNNIDITKYVVLISESTNEKIVRWLDNDK